MDTKAWQCTAVQRWLGIVNYPSNHWKIEAWLCKAKCYFLAMHGSKGKDAIKIHHACYEYILTNKTTNDDKLPALIFLTRTRLLIYSFLIIFQMFGRLTVFVQPQPTLKINNFSFSINIKTSTCSAQMITEMNTLTCFRPSLVLNHSWFFVCGQAINSHLLFISTQPLQSTYLKHFNNIYTKSIEI